MYTEEFLDNLPEDKMEAIYQLSENFLMSKKSMIPSADAYEKYINAFGVLSEYVESEERMGIVGVEELNFDDPKASVIQSIEGDFKRVFQHAETHRHRKILDKSKENTRQKLNGTFQYEFSDEDVDRIQNLLNELRDYIVSSELFEEEHRQRLLKRLETVQKELHKKMSDIDKLWGLVGDAGVVLGKFGSDAKPFVDRIKEIANITWRTQAKSEELPSDTPTPLIEE